VIGREGKKMMKQRLRGTGRQHRVFRGNEQGTALVITLLVMLVLSLLGSGLLSVSFTETQVALNDRRMTQAFFNAEAALEEAKLRLSPTADPAIRITPVNSATWGVYLYTPAHASDYHTFDPQYQATYTPVPSVQNVIEWGVAKIRVKNPGVNPPSLLVTAWGADGPIRRQLELELEPSITDPKGGSAAHGKKDVKMGGNACTDSYDSSVGPYGPGNQGNLGGISTEGTKDKSIKLKGNAKVKGDAVVFSNDPALDPHAVVSVQEQAQHVEGEVLKKSADALPSVPSGEIPPGAIPLTSDKAKNDLQLSGDSIRVVPEGVYWVNKLHISGHAQLLTTGNVKIYVKEWVKVTGHGTFAPKDVKPGNLTLIVGATDDEDFGDDEDGNGYDKGKVKLSSDANLYAVIYAPDAKVKITRKGDFFGAIRAKAVNIKGNGCAHYDIALGGGGGVVGYNRKSWHEVIN